MNSQALNTMAKILQEWGIVLSDKNKSQLLNYQSLIIDRNESVGLVSRRDVGRIIQRHFLESLVLSREIKFHPALIVMDFGCGAGFPSIPLKIVFPEFHLYLVESQRKKALFLQKVIYELGLQYVTVLCERGEKLSSSPDFRETFDIVFARAVAPLEKVVEWCLPFLAEQGRLLVPGAPGEDLPKVEQRFTIWGGIRRIKMLPENMEFQGARKELEVIEIRAIKKQRDVY